MTNEEAAAILESEAEYLYSQDEPYNRKAFYMAIEALNERDELHERLKIMQHRCVCLTEGHLCKYCVYVDCEYKEQED